MIEHLYGFTRREWGRRVYRLRWKYRLTQKQLASLLIVHVCTVQRWEYAEHYPDYHSFKRFRSLERKLEHGVK